MTVFSSCAGTYSNAVNLEKELKENGIQANISVGCVSISPTPDQVNLAEQICKKFKASFDPGYSATQENILLQSEDGYKTLKRVTNNAIAVKKEWDC